MTVCDEPVCWLCLRPLGSRAQRHHLIPKAKRGRSTVALHPICHRAIHANFTNAELACIGAQRERLVAREGLARFLDWIARRPPDFHAPTQPRR